MRRALARGIVGLATIQAGVLVYHAALTIAFPYDLDYGEGYVLNDALRLARGEAIYVDIQQFPMVRSPYPPLFPWLWSLAVPLAGPAFWPGRLLSAAALLGLLSLTWWNARRARVGAVAAIAATGVVAASPLVYQWAAYARVDLLALVLAASGAAVAHWVGGRRGVTIAALLCALSLATKQSAIAAPLAIGLALFLRRRMDAALFAAVLVLPLVGGAVALDRATDGGFARHVLQGNAQNPFHLGRMAAYLAVFLALHLPLVAGAVWWSVRSRRGIPGPLALYPLFALAAAASVGNEGSSVNYLLEPVVACALAVPFAWRAASAEAAALPLFLAALQLALLLHWPNGFGVDYLAVAPHGRTPTTGDYAAAGRVDAAVRAEPGDAIAEPAGFALRNGRPVYVQPIDLRAEQFRGRWDSRPLLRALSDGRFPLVVSAYELFPDDVERVLEADFRVAEEIPSPNGLTFRLYRYAR